MATSLDPETHQPPCIPFSASRRGSREEGGWSGSPKERRSKLEVDDTSSPRRKSLNFGSNPAACEARSPRRRSSGFGAKLSLSEDVSKSPRRKSTNPGSPRKSASVEEGANPSPRGRRQSFTLAATEMPPEPEWNSLMPAWQRRKIFSVARVTHSEFEECSCPKAKLQLAAGAIHKGWRTTEVKSRIVDIWKEAASDAEAVKKREERRTKACAEAEKAPKPPPPQVFLAEFRDLRGQLDELRHAKTVCIPTRITSMVHKLNDKLMSLDKLREMATAHSVGLEDLKRKFDNQLGSVNKLKDTLTPDMNRLSDTLKEQVAEQHVDAGRKAELRKSLFVVDHCLLALGIMSSSVSLWRPNKDDEPSSDSDGLLDEEDRELEMQTSRCRTSRAPSFGGGGSAHFVSLKARDNTDIGSGQSGAGRADHKEAACWREEMLGLRSQEARLQTETPFCEPESPAKQEFKQSEKQETHESHQLEQSQKQFEQCDDQQYEHSRLNSNEWLSNGEMLPDIGMDNKRFSNDRTFSKSEIAPTASSQAHVQGVHQAHSQGGRHRDGGVGGHHGLGAVVVPDLEDGSHPAGHTNQNDELVQNTGQLEAVQEPSRYSKAVRRENTGQLEAVREPPSYSEAVRRQNTGQLEAVERPTSYSKAVRRENTGQLEAVQQPSSYSEAVRRGPIPSVPGRKKLFAVAKLSELKPRYRRPREQFSLDNLTGLDKQLVAAILAKDRSSAELVDLAIEHSAISEAISPEPLWQPRCTSAQKTLLSEPMTSRTSSPRAPSRTSGRTSSRMSRPAAGPECTSDFQVRPFIFAGQVWQSVEQCYEALKFADRGMREHIRRIDKKISDAICQAT